MVLQCDILVRKALMGTHNAIFGIFSSLPAYKLEVMLCIFSILNLICGLIYLAYLNRQKLSVNRDFKTNKKVISWFFWQQVLVMFIWVGSWYKVTVDKDVNILMTFDYYSMIGQSTPYYESSGINCMFKFFVMLHSLITYAYVYYSCDTNEAHKFEFAIVLSFITITALGLCSITEFLTMFLLLELQGFCTVLLAAMSRKQSAIEAALKYFITTAIGSGSLLFGVSLCYYVAGTTSIDVIFNLVKSSESFSLPMIAFSLILVGLFYKLVVFPFHQWGGDVYQGVSPMVAGIFSILPKFSVVIILLRLITYMAVSIDENIFWLSNLGIIIAWLGLLTMFFAILMAYAEKKIQKLFFYSGMTSTGYFIFVIGLFISAPNAWETFVIDCLIFYQVYLFNTWVLWHTLSYNLYNVSTKKHLVYLKELSGFGKKYPGVGIMISISTLSLISIPPLSGFLGKFYFATHLIEQNFEIAAFLFLLYGAIASWYYLRLLKLIWFDAYNPVFLGVWNKDPMVISVLLTLFMIGLWVDPSFLFALFDNIATLRIYITD